MDLSINHQLILILESLEVGDDHSNFRRASMPILMEMINGGLLSFNPKKKGGRSMRRSIWLVSDKNAVNMEDGYSLHVVHTQGKESKLFAEPSENKKSTELYSNSPENVEGLLRIIFETLQNVENTDHIVLFIQSMAIDLQ